MTAISFALLALCLLIGFVYYERSRPSAQMLALIATLAGLAAIGRIAFAPLPNVKPTTDIVFFSGYSLGAVPGFVIGAIAAFASNFVFGQGPWLPWQMLAWGLVGAGAAVLGRLAAQRLGRVALACACAASGLFFGEIMNISQWVMYSGDHSAAKLWALVVLGLPFDIAHAAGNAGFCLLFGPALARMLTRFKARSEVVWHDAAADDRFLHQPSG